MLLQRRQLLTAATRTGLAATALTLDLPHTPSNPAYTQHAPP